MAKKAAPQSRVRKAKASSIQPTAQMPVSPVVAPGTPSRPIVLFIRAIFVLLIIWVGVKVFWKPSGISNASNAQAPVPVPTPIQRMTIVVNINGIKSEWGYSGWSTDGSANPNIDKSIQGTDLEVHDKKYKRGIGTHAPSKIVFDLKKKVQKFSCMVGADNSGGASDCVIFKVFGDGKKLFESPEMSGGLDALPVDVNVSGVDELTLQMDFGCGTSGWGHGDWINPKFSRN